MLRGAPEGAEFAIDQTFSGELTYLKNINGDEYDEFTNGKWSHINHFAFNSGDGYGVVCIDLRILKRLVESVDIVNKLNGIEELKRVYETRPFDLAYSDLKQAIQDYESIYGDSENA